MESPWYEWKKNANCPLLAGINADRLTVRDAGTYECSVVDTYTGMALSRTFLVRTPRKKQELNKDLIYKLLTIVHCVLPDVAEMKRKNISPRGDNNH